MTKYKVSDIKWDIDEIGFEDSGYESMSEYLKDLKEHYKLLGLPESVEFEVDELELEFRKRSEFNPEIFEQYVSDMLSDKYGFCHKGFKLDKV